MATKPKRARNAKGHYKADDPTTPDINEAFEQDEKPVVKPAEKPAEKPGEKAGDKKDEKDKHNTSSALSSVPSTRFGSNSRSNSREVSVSRSKSRAHQSDPLQILQGNLAGVRRENSGDGSR